MREIQEITLKVNQFILRDKASGKTVTVRSVLNLQELVSLIEEQEKEAARSKVEDTLAGLYGSDTR